MIHPIFVRATRLPSRRRARPIGTTIFPAARLGFWMSGWVKGEDHLVVEPCDKSDVGPAQDGRYHGRRRDRHGVHFARDQRGHGDSSVDVDDPCVQSLALVGAGLGGDPDRRHRGYRGGIGNPCLWLFPAPLGAATTLVETTRSQMIVQITAANRIIRVPPSRYMHPGKSLSIQRGFVDLLTR